MTTLSELPAKGIAKLLGAQVRVDFVKESGPKCRFVYGNLCTWDPESHSIVLAQFDVDDEDGQDSRTAVDEPARLLLIPGDSIQNVQILEEPTSSSQIPAEESAGAQISDVKPKKTTTGISLPMVENSAQLRAKLDRLFCPTVAKPESEHQQKVERKEGAMEIGVGSPSTAAAATTSAAAEQPVRKRSPIETLKIFDDFVSAKRRRVIDVLNKNGIKFVEEPYTVAAAMGNIVREQNKEKKKPGRRSKRSKRPGGHSVEEEAEEEETAVTNTVLVLGPRGSLRIYPPYGKEQIVGNPASEVKRLTLMLTVADVFDN